MGKGAHFARRARHLSSRRAVKKRIFPHDTAEPPSQKSPMHYRTSMAG